jgi:pimeloyl-ACP methyl ester carboxylesterase
MRNMTAMITALLVLVAIALIAACIHISDLKTQSAMVFGKRRKLLASHQFFWENTRRFTHMTGTVAAPVLKRIEKEPSASVPSSLSYVLWLANREDGSANIPPSTRGVVFMLKGTGGNVQQNGRLAQLYLEEGFDVCMYDYRGDGMSSSLPDGIVLEEEIVFGDSDAVFRHVTAEYRAIGRSLIIVSTGISTAVGAYIAQMNEDATWIADSPITSLRDYLGQYHVPHTLTDMLHFTFDAEAMMPNVGADVYILCSEDDPTAAPFMAHRMHVAALARSPARGTTLVYVGHASQVPFLHTSEYCAALVRVLDDISPRGSRMDVMD